MMSEQKTNNSPLPTAIGAVAHLLQHKLSNGDVAALRRLDVSNPVSAAYWKIVVGVLEPKGLISGTTRDESEHRWAVILRAMAHLGSLHCPTRRLGSALAEARFSELRFTRLLRADWPLLEDEIRYAVAFLASKGQPVDALDLARFVLNKGTDRDSTTARQISRDYYRSINRKGENS